MKLVQLECDICGAVEPLIDILTEAEITMLCRVCWEDMLTRAGDE